jgi:outer membrane biosynthesis protein TonB
VPSKPPAKSAKPAAAKAPAKAAKPAAKPADKAPAKPASAKPAATAGKGDKPAGKAPLPPLARGSGPAAAAAKGTTEEAPAPKMEKLAEGTLCQIEILKDGHFFIARTQTESGQAKEFKNTVFEDLLTEMLITLQEQLAD